MHLNTALSALSARPINSLLPKKLKYLVPLVGLLLSCDSHLQGEPPLHKAAYKGEVTQIEMLIQAGEKVNSLNSEGATPLHWAAFKGQLEAAKILVKYGADVNAKTNKGSTPLRLATTHKKESLINYLKSRGGMVD